MRTASLTLSAAMMLLLLPLPVLGESVSLSDVAGRTIEAVIYLDQTLEVEGRTAPFKVEQSWTVALDADRNVQTTMQSTVRGPRGARKAEPLTGSFVLDEQRPIPSRGGGEGLFTFEGGTLTFVRTMRAGAYRMSYAFARSATGLTCTATAAFAREGAGPIRFTSPFGQEVKVISSKQASATCRVVDR